MKTLLERFRELPDYRKCKQLKFNVGEVMYLSLLALLAGAYCFFIPLRTKNYISTN